MSGYDYYLSFENKVDVVMEKLSKIEFKVGYGALFASAVVCGIGFTTGVMLVNTVDRKIKEILD